VQFLWFFFHQCIFISCLGHQLPGPRYYLPFAVVQCITDNDYNDICIIVIFIDASVAFRYCAPRRKEQLAEPNIWEPHLDFKRKIKSIGCTIMSAVCCFLNIV